MFVTVSGNVSGWGFSSSTDMSILWDWQFTQNVYTNVFATYAYIQVVKFKINKYARLLSVQKGYLLTWKIMTGINMLAF